MAARVESQRRVGTEVDPIRANRWRQRQIYPTPGSAAVARIITAHRQTKDFVRAPREHLRRARIEGDESLTLWSAFVGNVDVAAGSHRGGGATISQRPVLRQIGILVPPGRIM